MILLTEKRQLQFQNVEVNKKLELHALMQAKWQSKNSQWTSYNAFFTIMHVDCNEREGSISKLQFLKQNNSGQHNYSN
jgi:hypothetical protein